MVHEVFVSYDIEDKQACDEVYRTLEKNGISCWVYSRDFATGDSVDRITEAIGNSKAMIVIYSKDSRISNHVATEVDIAYAKHLPIIIFNIDGSSKKGNQEFFKENVTWMSAFPDNYTQVKLLIKKTGEEIGRTVDEPVVDKKIRLSPPSPVRKYLKIAIPVALVIVLAYILLVMPAGQHSDGSGIFSMEISGVDVREVNGMSFYAVLGDVCNMPENPEEYVMETTYLDENGDVVYSDSSTLDEFSSGVISSANLEGGNVTSVHLKVFDLNEKEICEDSFNLA